MGLITSRHYLSERNENGGTEDKQKLINLKYESPAAAMAAELMVGFWFGIGVILAVKTVQSLEYCIEELISRKC